mgnify:CR=1 FL=1
MIEHTQIIEKFISQARLSPFGTMEAYKLNLQKSKQSYIPLAILEVSLRNQVNHLFAVLYGSQWLIKGVSELHQKEQEKISFAKATLKRNHTIFTQDKLIAELNFGFWTALFRSVYSKQMRIPNLVKVFPNLPPPTEKFINRDILSSKLNHIRKFRNRVFHHENIIKDEFQNIHQEILELIRYLDAKLVTLVEEVNKEE